MPVKNIVFDFGGVLIDWNPKYLYRRLFDTEREVEWFLENICTNEWNVQQDAGRSLEDGTKLLAEQFPEQREKIEWFYKGWTEMLGGPIQRNVELLEPLKGKYRMFGLTNWSAETFPIALKRYHFLQNFEDIVVSGVEKLIKPYPGIYHVLLERNNLQPKECLFMDDNIKNIEAADKIGFQTIHVNNDLDLRKSLEDMHIL